jgi:hypothetical protein
MDRHRAAGARRIVVFGEALSEGAKEAKGGEKATAQLGQRVDIGYRCDSHILSAVG